ncbi:hypothetical protein OHA18_37000 [Kribbella sp. NBC_00709]|uniref:hypothetical protein n=1 Tax=Kribbella sp. NBC_00709 TaxID=2975972 RepID=UPI002E2CABB3|nr:hypothetical protein [Kribbella sp. NBC_00709]
MGQRSPLVTLAATAVGLVGFMVVNSTQTGNPTPAGSPAATATAQDSATPSATPTAPGTVTPTATETTMPAPSKPPAQVTAVYAGRTGDRVASLAIATKGDRAAAYVCDGRSLEAWLTGTFRAGRLDLRSKTGERLAATITSSTATGTFTLSGRTLRFAIAKAGPPAGLYRARNTTSTIGWIVLPDGKQVGVDNDGTPAPAPPLDTTTRAATVNGVAVTAQAVIGDETF